MNKLIVENRAPITDVAAMQYAADAAKQCENKRTGMLAHMFGSVTVHRGWSNGAQTFIVMETERVTA